MRQAFTYPQACAHEHLFLPWFKGDTWAAWDAITKAIFGLPLSPDELPIFRDLTGRNAAPAAQVQEAWLIMGRRSGKDVRAASIAVYLATVAAPLFAKYLVPGESGVVQILAVDRNQASVAFKYCKAFLQSPALKPLVKRTTADSIELTNDLAIEVTTNDARRVRGRTVVCTILDEVAHWRSENSLLPDVDTYNAIRPSMATIPNALLIGISSAYAKKGLLYQKWKEHWGKDDPSTLVVVAPTWVMNPMLPKDGTFITGEYKRDAISARSEFGSEWRDDISEFIDIETLEDATDFGVKVRPPINGIRYVAFVDPSGGRNDAMCCAIAHREDDGTAVIDCLMTQQPPFHPQRVTEQFAATMKNYRITTCRGDRYGAAWVQTAFEKCGIQYRPADKVKSDLYLNLIPPLHSGQVRLLDDEPTRVQIASLERRASRTGRETIDHPVGSHDDKANVIAGAVALALLERPDTRITRPAMPRRLHGGGEGLLRAVAPSKVKRRMTPSEVDAAQNELAKQERRARLGGGS